MINDDGCPIPISLIPLLMAMDVPFLFLLGEWVSHLLSYKKLICYVMLEAQPLLTVRLYV